MPWAPGFLLRYTLRSNEWIPRVSAPILILHGDADEVIPVAQGQLLSKSAKQADFVTIHGGHHNDLSMFPEYWRGLGDFLDRISARR